VLVGAAAVGEHQHPGGRGGGRPFDRADVERLAQSSPSQKSICSMRPTTSMPVKYTLPERG